MIVPLLLALSAAAAKPAATAVAPVAEPQVQLSDIDQAIRVGRLEQAQIMVGRALATGQKGAHVDLILADLAYALGKNEEALLRYQALLAIAPDDGALAERAGISALKAGQVEVAVGLLDRSTKSPNASWRAWNARGVAADFRATGQTGIMIAGGGVPMDAVISDFGAGAAEMLSPDAAANHALCGA